jgi:hypothetical protein
VQCIPYLTTNDSIVGLRIVPLFPPICPHSSFEILLIALCSYLAEFKAFFGWKINTILFFSQNSTKMPPVTSRGRTLALLMFATGFLPLVSVALVSLFNHFFFDGISSPVSRINIVTAVSSSDLSPPDNVKSTDHEYWTDMASSSWGYTTFLYLDRQSHQSSLLWRQHVAYQEQSTIIRALGVLLVIVVVPLFGYIYALYTHPRMQQIRTPQGLLGTSIITATTTKKLSPRKERIQRQLMDYRTTYQGPERYLMWWQELWRRKNGSNNTDHFVVECPICLVEFRNGEEAVVSPHCHCTRSLFHESCILMWLAQSHRNPYQQCPCCRSPFFLNKSKTSDNFKYSRSELRSFYRIPRESGF